MKDYKLLPFCIMIMFISYPIYKYKENKMNERVEMLAKVERSKLPAEAAFKIEKTEDLIFSNYYLRKKEDKENLYVVHFSGNNKDSVLIHDIEKNVYNVIEKESVENLFSN